MASMVGIANIALINLGETRITSLDDQQKKAVLCKERLPDIIDAVLRAHPWKCAKTRASLPLHADVPAYEYSAQFMLPANPYCLRVLSIENYRERWEIEGRFILANTGAPLLMKFIKRITDPNEFDSLCTQAIAARLAADLAMPITQSQTHTDQMWKMYREKLMEARGINAQEGGAQEELQADTWLDARH